MSKKFCVAILVLALLPAFSSNLLAADKLRVAFPALAPALSPSWVTYETGIWKKNGVDVELILLSGGSRTIAALVSESVQVVIGSDVGVTKAILKGLNLITRRHDELSWLFPARFAGHSLGRGSQRKDFGDFIGTG